MWPFASKQDVHQEVDQLRQTLLTEIQQLRVPAPVIPPDLYHVSGKLDALQQQVQMLVNAQTPLLARLDDLQQQIKVIESLVSQISAITPSGEQKPIHDAIRARITSALAAINDLGNVHADWLEQHRVSHDEVQAIIAELQQKHQASAHHVFPPEQKDTEPITQV